MNDSNDELVFAPLGGLGEIGMNAGLYGFGPPGKRARSAVLRDLRLGYISRQEARETYGVEPTAQEVAEHHLPTGAAP